MAEKIITSKKWLVYLTAFLLIVCMRPYFTWGIYDANPPVRVMVLLIISYIFYYYKDPQLTRKYSTLAIIFVTAAMIAFLRGMTRSGYSIFGLFDIFSKVFLVTILFSKLSFKKDVLNALTTFYAVLVGLSLISWFLVQRGMLPPMGMTTSFDIEDRWFVRYPLLVIEQSLEEAIRFNAVFDEPGCVGTLGALFLCLNKFNLKDWRMIVILVTSIFSLSFFFYVISVAYLLLYLMFSKKSFILVGLLCAGVFIFYTKTIDDDVISKVIWERAEWDSTTNRFVGDNRANEEADKFYESKIGTWEYLIGFEDIETYHKLSEHSSTYRNIIAAYGIIFFTLYVLFFLALCTKNKIGIIPFVLYSMVLFALLYQRTSIYVPHIVFLFVVYSELEGQRERELSSSPQKITE